MKPEDVPSYFPVAMSGVTHLTDLRVDLIRLRSQGADVVDALKVLVTMTEAYERAVASLPRMGGFRIVEDESHAPRSGTVRVRGREDRRPSGHLRDI